MNRSMSIDIFPFLLCLLIVVLGCDFEDPVELVNEKPVLTNLPEGWQFTDNGAGVGTKRPNAFGLYDMSGNVWEWCEDRRHNDYDDAPDNGSAWLDNPVGSGRVIRGGGWTAPADRSRSAERYFMSPQDRRLSIGFRLVLVP